jgi:NDP-sugar pyrophosphorylase family protein
MKVIIPMAGFGNRFVEAGYRDPKPLITVNGKRILEYICGMFDKEDELIFICNDYHLATTPMKKIILEIRPDATIVGVPPHKKGPVYTMAGMESYIDDNEEVIVCYCDNPYLWNYTEFKKWIKESESDGCILSHVGFHPHRLSSTFMAYMKESNLVVSEIKEKEPYTEDPMQEHASTGTYYFKKGSYIKKYFQQLMDSDINYNGEYYVTLVYNLLIQDNLKVTCYPTDFVTVFGTPEEVENFEAWQTILRGLQVRNEEDLVRTYRYWKEYNEQGNTQ